MTDQPTLPLSIHEGVIKRHMLPDAVDPVLDQLHDAVATLRQNCNKSADLTGKVLRNALKTPAHNHKQARDAGFQLLEKATTSIDHAPGAHDDLANAIAGMAAIAQQPKPRMLVSYQADYANPASPSAPVWYEQTRDGLVRVDAGEHVSALSPLKNGCHPGRGIDSDTSDMLAAAAFNLRHGIRRPTK